MIAGIIAFAQVAMVGGPNAIGDERIVVFEAVSRYLKSGH